MQWYPFGTTKAENIIVKLRNKHCVFEFNEFVEEYLNDDVECVEEYFLNEFEEYTNSNQFICKLVEYPLDQFNQEESIPAAGLIFKLP